MTKMLVALVLAAGMPLGLSSQARPDFAGTWRLDEARSGSPGYVEFVRPNIRVVRMTGTTVELEVTQGKDTVRYQYPLTDTRPATLAEAAPANRAYWDGERLITETVQSVSGQTVTMREECTLGAGGREMIVERVVEVEHGYQVRGAQNYSIVRDVFLRVDQK